MRTPSAAEKGLFLGEFTFSVEGWVGWELIDAETGEVKRSSPMQKNVVLDQGLQEWIAGEAQMHVNGLMRKLKVGTGTSTPTQGDTGLDNPVATTSNRFSSSNGADSDFTVPYSYRWARAVYEFGKAEANNNLTEVGLESSSNSITITRQLFRDSQGDATTITKTSDEILRVRYELRLYFDLVDPVKSKSVDVDTRGTPVTTTIEWIPYNQPPGGFIEISTMADTSSFGSYNLYDSNTQPTDGSGNPDWQATSPEGVGTSETGVSPGDGVTITKDASNHQFDVEAAFDATQGNIGGIGGIACEFLGESNLVLFTFDPVLDKTDTDALVFTWRVALTQR